ncbi:hypothetical protein GWK47_026931 [Chionoecetes opilio]|uniref:Uncharacterized protein n=1 Tax=Chionoecetes opilio TaxID=41210 RepID=A0A8J8WD38_CHIOP|nr:hypothetical protein GWK47_026931 [Chionoecetes opilio]
MWTVSRSSFPGFGGANCSPSPSWAVARERAWRQRWSRPWRAWGVADQVVGMSFDTTASNTRAPETGPVSSSNRKWGKTCCISPVVTISWSWWYMRCSSVFFGGSSSPQHLLFKRFQPHGRHNREDFGTGIMVEEVATVLEDVKDEALRWTPSSPSRA